MKRILQRGKHLLKAKGRHGTHSPFVYAFVEQVMRLKTSYRVEGQNILTKKQLNLIGRTLQYLKPEVVYIDPILFPVLNKLNPFFPAAIFKILPSKEASVTDSGNGTFFICLPIRENNDLLQTVAAQKICSAIVLLSHKDEANQWEALKTAAVFTMVLDTWDMGFVSNHPDFKTKQYFRLR
jgi:hypothetical protein